MRLTLLPAAARQGRPWKNGGGVTRDVAAEPEGAGFETFDWRVSIAEVTSSGPFSVFPGVDRVLTVLSGAMELRVDGLRPERLAPDRGPYRFPGDAAAFAEVIEPVVDLNVMVRRGLSAEVRPTGSLLRLRGSTGLVVALEPSTLNDLKLSALDAMRIDEPSGNLSFVGAGWVIDFQ